jgi:hypothetical protein
MQLPRQSVSLARVLHRLHPIGTVFWFDDACMTVGEAIATLPTSPSAPDGLSFARWSGGLLNLTTRFKS